MTRKLKPIANPDLPKPPSGKYPAKAHARRVAKYIADNGGPSSGLIYLEGQSTKMTEDDDQASAFRPRRHFYYLTGCDLPDCYFAYDIAKDKSILWIPPVDPEYVMWAGMPLLPEEALQRYDVDDVQTTEGWKENHNAPIVSVMNELGKNSTVFVIRDRADLGIFQTTDIRQAFSPSINDGILREAIERCRVVKDDYEISLIRHANIVSSYAHEQVLASVTRASNERELNAVFVMHCHANGCKDMAYGCICAAGTAGSTLHYVHNDQPLQGKDNILLDAGCEYSCYCADITRTFPITADGKFTKESKEIYDLVHLMQSECFKMIKAGVMWEDVHMKAHTVAAEGLQKLGIFNKDLGLQQILDSHITTRFFPHGLGHYLGMDTHDCGGNANYEDPNPYFAYLRVRGKLPVNAVITNEPGIYFREFPMRQELSDGKWDGIVDQEVLSRYWRVGGVRLEDDIVVKEDGYENLTTVSSDWQSVQAMVSASQPDFVPA